MKKKGLRWRTHVRHLLNGHDYGVGSNGGSIDKLRRNKRLVVLFRFSNCSIFNNGLLASTRNTQFGLWSFVFGYIAGWLCFVGHLFRV